MALLERVATLIRANLNDMIDKAEDPEKMIKQIILDMQNQLLQLKTQVAIAIADLHLLERKQKENETLALEWERKVDKALDREHDELARAAVERSLNYRALATSFAQQTDDQRAQVEALKNSLTRLNQKLVEAQAKSELLIAQHRRARVAARASHAESSVREGAASSQFQRLREKVQEAETLGLAEAELLADPVEDQFARIEKDEAIDKLLSEIKARRAP